MARAFSEIAFTDAVRAQQARLGSAPQNDRFLTPDAAPANRFGEAEARFIAQRDGFYQASVSETGWPYVQFRGGPRGFLRALDETTLGYADFRGNRQYVSLGNLTGDSRIAMILMDYPNQRRLKILGHARMVDAAEDPDLIAALHPPYYRAKAERAVLVRLAGFDWNCPQHIPQRLTLEELESVLAPTREEISELRAENEALKAEVARLQAVAAPK